MGDGSSFGAAIFFETSNFLINSTLFVNNTGAFDGAFYCSFQSTLQLMNSTFIGNNAMIGGVIVAQSVL